jgi:hypothetical protein
MIFISVDLPAPFSPRMEWISPACTSRDTSWLAPTQAKRLLIRSSWSLGTVTRW